MTPVSFEGRFGWFHDAPGDVGVVLCGAQGYEQLCAHRGWREFADMIARTGYPALRFDYLGSGDSIGSDLDPGRLDAWKESVRLAIEWLRTATGVRKIVLVGLRLGGALAAQIAAQDNDVIGLAMLAPVWSGRSYVRELTALGGMMNRQVRVPDEGGQPDILEIGGFPVTQETQGELRAIDLAKSLTRVPGRAFLAMPEGAANTAAIVDRLTASGAKVETADFSGYSDYLAEPTFSKTPASVFMPVCAWLERECPSEARVAIEQTPNVVELSGAGFRETPVHFGASDSLFGMLCRPESSGKTGPVVLFLNGGANPHIGWARMTVDQARSLARNGIASLRIDIAGLGDSPPAAGRSAKILYAEEPRADVRSALDWLEAQGMRECIAVGLCSGAHLAFHTAVEDPRIVGAVMVNLQKFIWKATDSLEISIRQAYRSTGFYKSQMIRTDTWKRLLRGEIAVIPIAMTLVRRIARTAGSRIERIFALLNPYAKDDSSVVRRAFATLSRRGARVLVVYCAEDGGLDELALHMGPAGRRLARYPGASVAILEYGDHNLTPRWSRQRFLELLNGFVATDARPARAP